MQVLRSQFLTKNILILQNVPIPPNCMLPSFGVSLFSLSSVVPKSINNFSCSFLHNILALKLLSPQYLGPQSILCHCHFLIDTIGLRYLQGGIQFVWLAIFLFSCQFSLVYVLNTLRMLQNTTPLILSRC